MPLPGVSGERDRSRWPRLLQGPLSSTVPLWLFGLTAALLVAALTLAAAGLASAGSEDDRAGLLDRARAAELQAESLRREVDAVGRERDRLRVNLAAAESRVTELEDQLEARSGDLATRNTELTSAEEALQSLRERVAALEEERAQQEEQLSALHECLDGTRVALEFMREGLEEPADLALQAIADACAAASEGGGA